MEIEPEKAINDLDATNNRISDEYVMNSINQDDPFTSLIALNYLKFTNNKFNIIPQSILHLATLKYLDFNMNNDFER